MNDHQSSKPLLELEDLWKSYDSGDKELEILQGVQLEVTPQSYYSIIGPSGVGKTTLLNIMGLLDEPTSGSIRFHGNDIAGASESQKSTIRNEQIGFVFQFYHLIPELTALENVCLPAMIDFMGFQWFRNRNDVRERAHTLLNEVGLTDREDHSPTELSGGERQRVAIARAMIQYPDVLICDEPTGNLDKETGDRILELLEKMHKQHQTALIIASHNKSQASRAERTYQIADGKLTHLKEQKEPV